MFEQKSWLPSSIVLHVKHTIQKVQNLAVTPTLKRVGMASTISDSYYDSWSTRRLATAQLQHLPTRCNRDSLLYIVTLQTPLQKVDDQRFHFSFSLKTQVPIFC